MAEKWIKVSRKLVPVAHPFLNSLPLYPGYIQYDVYSRHFVIKRCSLQEPAAYRIYSVEISMESLLQH